MVSSRIYLRLLSFPLEGRQPWNHAVRRELYHHSNVYSVNCVPLLRDLPSPVWLIYSSPDTPGQNEVISKACRNSPLSRASVLMSHPLTGGGWRPKKGGNTRRSSHGCGSQKSIPSGPRQAREINFALRLAQIASLPNERPRVFERLHLFFRAEKDCLVPWLSRTGH
jgi:hypothetical protein